MEQQDPNRTTGHDSQQAPSAVATKQEWDSYSIFQVVAYTVISLAMLAFFIYLAVHGVS